MENSRTANRHSSRAPKSPAAPPPVPMSPAPLPLERTTTEAAPPIPATDAAPTVWRQWLAGGSPREVLARIVNEDPLGVREHVARALRTGAWLLDADRVVLRAFALVARHAVRYRGRPDVDAWLAQLCEEAIEAILREDAEAERRPMAPGHEPGRDHGTAFAALARPLGLEPEAMGRACLAFNRLPASDRGAFFALVIAGQTLDEVVRASGDSATDVARRARRALEAILARAQSASPAQSAPVAQSASVAKAFPPAEPRTGTNRRPADRASPTHSTEEGP